MEGFEMSGRSKLLNPYIIKIYQNKQTRISCLAPVDFQGVYSKGFEV